VTRGDYDRLDDIANSDDLVMDAVAMRLLELGEAVKGLSPEITATEPDVDWTGAAGMRDFLAHHYFASRPDIVQRTIDERLPGLGAAVTRMLARIADPDS